MASDTSRRASNPPLSAHQTYPTPPPPPPPPPLPPPKNVTARNAFARFVTQSLSTYGAARPQTAQTSRSDSSRSRAAPLLPVISGVNALSSQDATHRTGLEISAFDINQERTHAILAGREILKTVHVNGTRCSEEANLRSAIINYASHNTRGSGRHRETLDIHDVKWSHGAFSTHIATAATNGKVVLYDLGRAGIELARLHEHYRQVHKLAFNPHQGYLLLSGSQDASVRLWDLRKMSKDKDAITCRSQQAYYGQSEGIRDLRWSPTDGFEFAFGTDNGVIQRWDIRYAKGPKLKISAHDKTCHAIDWHPDGKHLLSASSDKTVKAWDFSSDQRRQKPTLVLRAPYPVSNVRWRPPCFTSGKQDQGAWHSTQFATSFEKHSPILLWDFRRPYLPFREIVRWSTPPTDMLWHSQHLLWTVGREGIFAQTDIHFAPKVLDRRNMQASALSPTGEISVFSQKRSKRRDSGLEYLSDYSSLYESKDRQSIAENAALASLSRSSADDSIDDAFLSSSFVRHHGRTSSNRSTKSISSTPPSDEFPITTLQDSLKDRGFHYRPNQASFYGNIGGAIEYAHFAYLAQKYKSAALKEPLSIESFHDLEKTFEKNADYAQRTSAYRIAQSFRITGVAVSFMLNRRAEAMRRRRLGLASDKQTGKVFKQSTLVKAKKAEDRTSRALTAKPLQVPESHLKQALESTSNVPTPLARPQNNPPITAQAAVPSLAELDQEESVALPPPVREPSSISPTIQRGPSDPRRSHLQRPEFNGPHWYGSTGDLSEKRAMLSTYRQPPKAPLNLEQPNVLSPQTGPINIPPALGRHNSDESFAMFSTSSDSRGLSMPGSLASQRSLSRPMEVLPEAWEHMESAESSGVWKSGSDKMSRGDSGGSSENLGKSSWTGSGSLNLSSGSIEDPLAIPPPCVNPADHVRFEEPKDRQAPRRMSKVATASESRIKPSNTVSHPVRLSSAVDFGTSSSESQPSHSTSSTSNTSSSRGINLESSGTIVPEESTARISSDVAVQPPKLHQESISAPAVFQDEKRSESTSQSQSLVLADFTSTAPDDSESCLPFSIVDLLQSLLVYHTSTLADAQTASHLILLLSPLLPQTHPTSNINVSRMLNAYTDHLAALGLPPSKIEETLSTSLSGLLQSGLQPLHVESILSTYHDQLLCLALYNSAAQLRRLCYPAFPAVYEQSLKDTSIGLLCRACGNPINNPRGKMRCENCAKRQAPCPVCWCKRPAVEFPGPKSKKVKRKKSKSRASSFAASSFTETSVSLALSNNDATDTADPERSTVDPRPAAQDTTSSMTQTQTATLWLTCPLCDHSGHLACLSSWFASSSDDAAAPESEGACPTPGCTCDCAPGALRDERAQKVEARLRKSERERGREGGVKGDEWRVAESRAVGRVRGLVEPPVAGGAAASAKDKEGKKVRLVEPESSGAPKRTWVMGN